MREIAVYWWLYVWALAMPLVTLWFARTRGQVIRSLLWMALALGWAHLLAWLTENLPGPAALGVLALGVGIHIFGGALAAALSVRARRRHEGAETLTAADAHRLTLRVLAFPVGPIVLFMAGWWIAWGAGLMLADHPVDGRAGVEEMIPARTEYDVPFEELDRMSLTTEPFELTGTVVGWGWDRHLGSMILVIAEAQCDDPRVGPGRIAVVVDSPAALSLEEVARGDEVSLRVVFYSSPAVLKAIPEDGSRYAASDMPEAAFLELYADPDYRWDPTPVRTMSGNTSSPAELEMEGRHVIFLLLYTDDGMVPFTVPLDQAGPVVWWGDMAEPANSDLGRSLIYQHTSASADAELAGERGRAAIVVVLNKNGECVEMRFP